MLRLPAAAVFVSLVLGLTFPDYTGAQSRSGFELEFHPAGCFQNVPALVRGRSGPINWSDKKVQDLVHEAAAPFADECRQTRLVDLIEVNPDGKVVTQRFMYGGARQGQTGKVALQQRFMGLAKMRPNDMQQAFMSLERGLMIAAVEASPNWAENDLADRGYAASKLIHSEPGLRVYAGRVSTHPRQAHRPWKLVFVHDIAADEPVILVEQRIADGGTDGAVYVAAAEVERFQRVLDSIGPTFVERSSTVHYVDGFHHPNDDRRVILETEAIETPLVSLGRKITWEDRYVAQNEERLLWYVQNLGTRRAINSVAHARAAYPAFVPEAPGADTADVVASARFDELGLTLNQVRSTTSKGDDTYVLRVTESSLPNADSLRGAQFIGINDASFYSLANLDDALNFIEPGTQLTLKFYTNRNFSESVTAQAATSTRQFPKIRISAPSQSYIAQQTALRTKAVDEGYVYKNENYWASFTGSDIREIIEGRSGYIQPNSRLANLTLKEYVKHLQTGDCARRLGDDYGVFTITETTKTFDGYGNLVNTSTSNLGTVKVPRRFVGIYGMQYGIKDSSFTVAEGVRAAFDLATQSNTPGGLNQMAREISQVSEFIRSVTQDIETLIRLETCDSPVVAQFDENFYRYLNNKQPVQIEPAALAGARQKTDDVLAPGSAQTLATACMAEGDFRSSMSTYCRCQAAYFEGILPAQQVELGIQNFRLVENLVEGGLIGPSDAYMNMRRRCVTR